jgi:hypothetical protein
MKAVYGGKSSQKPGERQTWFDLFVERKPGGGVYDFIQEEVKRSSGLNS